MGELQLEEISGYLNLETLYRTRQGFFFLVDTEIESDFDKEGFPEGATPQGCPKSWKSNPRHPIKPLHGKVFYWPVRVLSVSFEGLVST